MLNAHPFSIAIVIKKQIGRYTKLHDSIYRGNNGRPKFAQMGEYLTHTHMLSTSARVGSYQ